MGSQLGQEDLARGLDQLEEELGLMEGFKAELVLCVLVSSWLEYWNLKVNYAKSVNLKRINTSNISIVSKYSFSIFLRKNSLILELFILAMKKISAVGGWWKTAKGKEKRKSRKAVQVQNYANFSSWVGTGLMYSSPIVDSFNKYYKTSIKY